MLYELYCSLDISYSIYSTANSFKHLDSTHLLLEDCQSNTWPGLIHRGGGRRLLGSLHSELGSQPVLQLLLRALLLVLLRLVTIGNAISFPCEFAWCILYRCALVYSLN